MKKLLAKKRRILRARKARTYLTRFVSGFAAMVVFITTYALVLPAITMEKEADCGIETHQHDDSCYEMQLVCGLEESEGHEHDDSCFEVSMVLVCTEEEHTHEEACYGEDGELTCQIPEHAHGEKCFEEERGLVCELEESKGHTHDDSCFTKELACGKEVHTHSEACFKSDEKDEPAESKDSEGSEDTGADASEEETREEDAAEADDETESSADITDSSDADDASVNNDDEIETEQRQAEEIEREELNDTETEDIAAAAEDAEYVDNADAAENTETVFITQDAEGAEVAGTVEPGFPAVCFNDTIAVRSGSLAFDTSEELPGKTTLAVYVEADEGTFPEGTVMVLGTVSDMDAVAEAVEEAVAGDQNVSNKTRGFHAVDISFRDTDGNEIEPLRPIRVSITSEEIKRAAEDETTAPVVVHVEDAPAEGKGSDDTSNAGPASIVVAEVTSAPVLEADADGADQNGKSAAGTKEDGAADTLTFEADTFSVYAIVYTVDFHWEVDGKMYEFSLPGGGFVSLEALMEVLGVAEGADGHDMEETADSADVLTVLEVSPSKTTREFVADIEDVSFSTPELLCVSRVKENTTIGALKESLGLEVQYSAELKAEQIEAINNAAVESGDWALISLLPFNTEETLTVTMKTGEVFAVKVTDAQISTNILTADGKTYKITVTYEDDAQIPDGTILDVSEIEPGTDEYVQHLGQAWLEVNKEYFEVEEMRGHYNEGMGDLPDVHLVNLDDARFFDINLIYDGQVIEPAAPVHVEIVYEEGLDAAGGTVAGVAHFTEEGVELIEDVETVTENDAVIRFSYDQPGFSDTGTYVGQETFDQTEGPVTAPAPDKTDYPMLKAAGKKGPEADGTSNETTDDIAEENNLPRPVGNKTLTPNKASDGTKDDTYTLTLSVSGTSKSSTETIVNKSNVLIVMDRSSSMINNNVSAYTEYTGSYQNGTTYYGVDGDNYFTLFYNTRDGKYYRTHTAGPMGGYSNQYTGAIYTCTQKTRLAEEQTALSLLLNQLLSKNGTGTTAEGVSLEDIIEVSLISFADQRYAGKDTEIGWTTDYDRLMAGVNKGTYTSGTNWEDALKYALEVANAKQAEASQAGEEMYIIFLTDGEPTAVYGEKNGAHHYISNGKTTGGGFIVAYEAAKDDAAALVNAGYHLYNIFTYGTDEDYGYMVRLTNYAYSNGANDTTTETTDAVKKYFTNARTTDKLLTAFQNIFSLVSDSVAYGKVSITDGLTTDAMTTTLVHGRTEGYKYTVTGTIGELYSVTAAGSLEGQTEVTFTINGHDYPGEKKTAVIDGVSHEYWSCTIGEGEAAVEYKMTLADVSEDGMLTWDLTGIGTLMDGYTYSASFVVWPDQEAYDYVAGLNNGLPGYTWSKGAGTYENLTSTKGYEKGGVERFPSIVKYPDGTFAVLTNTEQKVYYSIVETKEENGVTTTTYDGPYDFELPTPDPMPLKKTDMGVAKEWDDSLDPDQLDEILWKDHDGEKQDSTEYGVTLRVWRADTQEQLADMVEADADNSYMDVTVGWNESKGQYIWENNFDVSPGLMVSLDDARKWGVQIENDKIIRYTRTVADSETGNETSTTTDYYVLETGHYYTLSEPGIERHFELNTIVYHPMVVDGVLSNVMFRADGTVDRIVPMSTVTATNTLKGGINIQKKLYSGVPGAEGTQEITTTNETFSITVEMFNADGTPYVDWDYRVYYGDNNPLKTDTTDVSGHYFGTAAAQAESGSTGEVDPVNGGHNTITLNYYPGDIVRIINIPAGVTYKVKETQADESAFAFDSTLYEISSGSADNFVPDTAGADGYYTVQGNTSSQATVRNRTGLSEIELKKIGDGVTSNTLEGVQFVLYYDEECTRQVVKDALGHEIGTTVTAADEETNEEAAADGETNEEAGTDGETDEETTAYDHVLITGADGKIRIGSLCGGTYYLVEISSAPGYNMLTEAIPVTIHADGTVTYIQESLTSLINSRQAVYEIEGGYGIHINNLSGFELPHTGGAGTYHIYLLGLMLTGLAAAGLMINRKRAAVLR